MTSSARGRWLAVLVCGMALAVPHGAAAASDDAVARRVMQTQASTLRAQFGTVQSCFTANSAPCLRSTAYGLYSVAVHARIRVVALRVQTLSPRVRSGVDLYVRALDLQAQSGYDLSRAAASRDIIRINQAMLRVRHAFAVGNQAMALVYA